MGLMGIVSLPKGAGRKTFAGLCAIRGRNAKWSLRRPLGIVLALGMIMTAQTVRGSDESEESGQPSDPRIEELTRQRDIAKLEKEIAEAEKAELAATLPQSETAGKAGTATVDDKAGYFGEVLAYRTLATAAQQIAEELATEQQSSSTVVITTDQGLAQKMMLWDVTHARLMGFYDEFSTQVKQFKQISRAECLHRSNPATDSD